jgi:hypothetical protein
MTKQKKRSLYQAFSLYDDEALPAESFEVRGYPIALMGVGVADVRRLSVPYARVRGIMAGENPDDPRLKESRAFLAIYTDFRFAIRVHGQSLDAIMDALKDRRLRVMTQWREADGPIPDGAPLIERISD